MAVQKKAPETVEVYEYVPFINGTDSLEPLRRVQQQYYNRANRIITKCTDPEDGTIDPFYVDLANTYRNHGDNVGLLCACSAETVDRT